MNECQAKCNCENHTWWKWWWKENKRIDRMRVLRDMTWKCWNFIWFGNCYLVGDGWNMMMINQVFFFCYQNENTKYFKLYILPWCRRLNIDQFGFRWAHILLHFYNILVYFSQVSDSKIFFFASFFQRKFKIKSNFHFVLRIKQFKSMLWTWLEKNVCRPQTFKFY